MTETMLPQRIGSKQAPAVFAIIPAFGRPTLLAQALASLADQGPALAGAIVVNNSRDEETKRVAAAAAVPTTVLTPSCNLGTAGGLAAGLHEFLARPAGTHAWIMDDDAMATPGALDAMLAAMARAGAGAAAPLLADENDRVRWVPCRLPWRDRSFLRAGPTREEFLRRCGGEPRRWPWSIWASLLVSRQAVAAIGFPRLELWSQFSDIEYTLRLTRGFTGVLVPQALCRHLPPESAGDSFDAKLFAALQNGSYVTLRLRHGWRALRHLPGQNFRYLRHYRWRLRAWINVARAFVEGAILGRPSGRTLHAVEFELARAAWSEAGTPGPRS